MTAHTGVLLIHGLGGTEYDLGALNKRLKPTGMDLHSLTLPGHGTRPQDLCGVHMEDWLEAITTRYRELAARYDTLHVIGMCMGALLAIELVKREDHQHGTLVALAAPVFIDGWATPWYREVRRLLYCLPGVADRMRVVEEEPYGLKNEQIRNIVKTKLRRHERFHYGWVPLSCIREVDRLRHRVVRGLDRIRCQTLIMHAREDELTSLRSAHFLARHIGGAAAPTQTRLEILENSYHMICVDNDRERVAASVLRFLAMPAPINDASLARSAPRRSSRSSRTVAA